MRIGWCFVQRSCQNWQEMEWLKLDAVTPYSFSHRKLKPQLDFVKEALFNKYAGSAKYKRKLRKLYWRLHPEEMGYDR